MAASKGKNTGRSGRNTKKKTAMEQEVGRFQTEIIIFVILAACVILMASNFGAGGFVGDAISNFCFGLMGLMAYLFPVVFFLKIAYNINVRNSENQKHRKRCFYVSGNQRTFPDNHTVGDYKKARYFGGR